MLRQMRMGPRAALTRALLCCVFAGCGTNGATREGEVAVATPVSSTTPGLLAANDPEVPAELAALGDPPQPSGVTFGVQIGPDGKLLRSFEETSGRSSRIEQPQPKSGSPAPEPKPEKFSGRLRTDVASDRAASLGAAEVVITFQDDIKVPRFPTPNYDESRTSSANRVAADRSMKLVDAIGSARKPGYDQLEAELSRDFGATVTERFWLIKGVVATLPLSQVRALSERPDVQHVQYAQSDDLPPHAGDNISDARARMNSDPYRPFLGNWIGALDTGVRSTHTLFVSPGRLDFVRDCVNGTSNECSTGMNLNPSDDCWNHGTRAIGVMVGNNNLTNTLRGVTDLVVDSFKVHPAGCGGYNAAAGVRAFQAAAVAQDHTILANIQASEALNGATSTAADAAYNTGRVVIAAAGNAGPGVGTVTSPGNAHKALAVGAITTITNTLRMDSGRGPTADNRVKPDLGGPADVHSISNASDTATAADLFMRTSSAAPHVAGAAGTFGNWWRSTHSGTEPGQIYAHMIANGNSATVSNDTGSGLIVLPTGSSMWGAKESITNSQVREITINFTNVPTAVTGAIWWPESTTTHNDIDVYLIRPDGSTAASGTSFDSVFEKARVTNGFVTGNWKIRIVGFSVSGTQSVFWSVTKWPNQ